MYLQNAVNVLLTHSSDGFRFSCYTNYSRLTGLSLSLSLSLTHTHTHTHTHLSTFSTLVYFSSLHLSYSPHNFIIFFYIYFKFNTVLINPAIFCVCKKVLELSFFNVMV